MIVSDLYKTWGYHYSRNQRLIFRTRVGINGGSKVEKDAAYFLLPSGTIMYYKFITIDPKMLIYKIQ